MVTPVLEWDRSREMKNSYVVMKLDMMLQQAKAIGVIDINDLHEFVVVFRPNYKFV